MKNPLTAVCVLLCTALLHAQPLPTATASSAPVSPQASPEARALLQFLHDLTGRHTLTGQHNFPNIRARNSEFAARYLGKTPVVFSSDFGHAKAGDTDSYLARPDIVQECIRQHHLGALVTLCWHAAPPTATEPVTFRKPPDSDPKALASVQGQLLDSQFKELLTPGTPLHQHWCEQVDAIAVFLKQLQEAHVPILWRPYHEMNGDWFWWGGRTSETAALYRQLFDRLVNHHHLTNLIWVWSMDRVTRPGMEHAKYFPGIEYVDVLGLDVYGNDFAQSYYTSLEQLAQGKPLALAEVGNVPSPEVLAQQPKWTFYVTWAGMVRNTSKQAYAALWKDPRLLNLNDPAYSVVSARYQADCGRPIVHITEAPADFSGTWLLNQELSHPGRMGAASAPARLDVVHDGNMLKIRTTRIMEYADDQVTDEVFTLDGKESKSDSMHSPRTITARLAPAGDTLDLESTVSWAWGPPGATMTTKDRWSLTEGGRVLSIQRSSSSPMGEQTVLLVFDRQ